jgi:GT2 family glycosyltransferase
VTRQEPAQHIAGATNAALGLARGELVAFLDHDDLLTPDALLEMVAVADAHSDADVIYSDHDILGADGRRCSPSFKPDWSPELLLSYMYFGHLKVYRRSVVEAVGGFREGFRGAADYDLALRVVEKSRGIHHVPKILCHWRASPRSMATGQDVKPESFESGRRALQEALDRRAVDAEAVQPDFARRHRMGLYQLRFRGAADQPVSIVIPTRDRLSLLAPCVASIEERTRHRNYRIVIVDNESREPETLDWLARTRHRVIRYPSGGVFDFAGMMNAAVAQVEDELVVLLNNDTVVVCEDWLTDLVGFGLLPGVGAVGAKLLYPDGRIQHAGVVLGVHGLTGHAFQPRRDSEDDLEYMAYAHVARNYLAVSAACMLTRKSCFQQVGGLDARHFKVAWNDVDYCLRLRQAGYRIVFAPRAVLLHLESQSRGDDKNPLEVRQMLARWRPYVDNDPYYSPHFSRLDAEFQLRTDPGEGERYYYREYYQS